MPITQVDKIWMDGELVDWRVRQVDHRPGSTTTVAYRATVRWDGVEQMHAETSLMRVQQLVLARTKLVDSEPASRF